ncbi:glycosyltransferase family 4 protein [Candidatus Latescibacterota bacterium]
MKIVHLIPGSGGTFYCQNCMRDSELVKSLKSLGHEIYMVPMYLPLSIDKNDKVNNIPIFYGAINLYLGEKFPLFRHIPMWLEKFFDSQTLLRYAAKKSGSTRATGLEEMTISMLKGEEGHQASQLEHLIQYLKTEIKPDVVHISNALLLGLARRLKNDLGTKVICSLQDENEWIDPMGETYQNKVWKLMSQKAADVDMFVASSRYYSDKSKELLNIPSEKIRVVSGGINLNGYESSPLPFDPPVIGYLCRMSEYFGLGIVAGAYIRLKQDERFRNLKLYITGGNTGDDKRFVSKMMREFYRLGFEKDVQIFEKFDKENRIGFLKSLTLLSVPVPTGEAFGTYQVEALAAGVPIVQPNIGGYPEFIEATGGGILYEPNDSEHLAQALESLLSEPERVRELGAQGRNTVMKNYSVDTMAKNIINVYENAVKNST